MVHYHNITQTILSVIMKKIRFVIILICCVLLSACKLKSHQNVGNTSKTAFTSAEWVADDSESAQNIDRYLSSMEVQGFSGAIIISDGDEVILRKGYGYANREKRQFYTPETIQTNGSITKQFTAAAILLLESRGELSVHDKISRYLDPLSEEMQDITIHQLLTHSSGMPRAIGPDDEPISAEAYLERLTGESLQFDPGSGFAYSNTGYSLLGIIVERVSGQSYEAFLHEELLLPAGLTETGYFIPDWDSERLAIGYRKGKRWGEIHEQRYQTGEVENGPSWHYRANGGLLTTVDDMYTWLTTVKGQGVLDGDVAERWTTGYVTEENGYSTYGYGWGVYDHNRWGKVITHNGSNGIFEADFVWLPEREIFFYIQGNTSMVPAGNQSGSILNAAFDSTFVMPPLIEADDSAVPAVAQQRAGVYYLEDGSLELTADDTRLVAKITGQPLFDLMFDHNDEQKKRFEELNARTRIAMNKIQDGHEDALSGLVDEETDAVAATAPFLGRINQIGNLDSLHVVGTFANTPGGLFHESGPWTTFVYAEFKNWNQYWNLVWNEDETYAADLRGPWPSYTLIPVGDKGYIGVRQGDDWQTVKLQFLNDCIILNESKACK